MKWRVSWYEYFKGDNGIIHKLYKGTLYDSLEDALGAVARLMSKKVEE